MILGDDGLIRVAVWSASTICAALMQIRRATLLAGLDGAIELRCRVIAAARLETSRPLSGFLLKPVERINARGAIGQRHRTTQNKSRHGDETRLALLSQFPVHPNGEQKPPGDP